MKTLHLIVHKQLLENQNYDGRFNDVLNRIAEIEKNQNLKVKQIPYNERDDLKIDLCIPLSKGFDRVILYGCSRFHACLDWVAERLHSRGIPVAYDIKGTTK